MAPGNPPYGKPTALDGAMFFNSFTGEMRAGGREAALIAHVRRQDQLVKPDQTDQEVLQRIHEVPEQDLAGIAQRDTLRLFQLLVLQ